MVILRFEPQISQIYTDFYQGNVRSVGTGGKYGSPLQITHYYPYGLPFAEGRGASVNRYKFTGKELITEDNLNFYDFEARMYQPQNAMWQRPDDLAEKRYWLSPYSFCRSNPVFYIDPSGYLDWPVPNEYNGAKGRKNKNNFGYPRGENRTHKGVDINIGSGDDDLGAPVYATHDGIVDRIVFYHQDHDAGGTRVRIKGRGGLQTFYMHLNDVSPNLKVGDRVEEGQQIGTVGGSGKGIPNEYGPHLHYEIIVDGKHINPSPNNAQLIDTQILQSELSSTPILIRRELDNIDVVAPRIFENAPIPHVVVPPPTAISPDAAIINPPTIQNN